MMLDFEVYVDDVRYAVPSLYLISAADEARARAVATDMLHASAHHQGVELRRGGKMIYAVGSFALPARAPGEAGEAGAASL